jgi:Flp pilus assembly protein TadG
VKRGISLAQERGQALTEFALVLPLLVTIVFAIVQLGITFNHYVTLTDAVRAGARQAAVSRLSGDPAQAAKQAVYGAANDLDPDELHVDVASGWDPGADVTVSATYPYSLTIFGLVFKSGWLTSSTTERVE